VACGLNSVRPWKQQGGALRRAQVERVRQTFAEAPAGALRVVALHHHLLGAPWRTAKRTIANRATVLGGLVDAGSVKRGTDQVIEFKVGDGASSVPVRYKGLLPDLFREGQGVVTEGVMSPAGIFVADTVLARHDETYMPREVADALKAQGVWQGSPPKQQTTAR